MTSGEKRTVIASEAKQTSLSRGKADRFVADALRDDGLGRSRPG